jgi:hypothetical protein
MGDAVSAGEKIGNINLACLNYLPVLSAFFPFILLIMASLQLPLLQPGLLFGMALLLVIMLLGLVWHNRQDHGISILTLASVSLLLYLWHFEHFDSAHSQLALPWYWLFFGIFLMFLWNMILDTSPISTSGSTDIRGVDITSSTIVFPGS